MAIVLCPQCGARTSSAAPACLSCGFAVGNGNAEETARRLARARRARARRMSMHAVLATLIGIGGGLWLMFGDMPKADGRMRMLAAALFAGGLGWYLYLRIRLWLDRHK